VEFGLLGLLEVWDQGQGVSFGRGRESALLAILLLRANTPVSADLLVRELWTEPAPPNAAKSVQQYVSRLRRRVGERLATTPGGYVLSVGPDELDCDRFESLAARARDALAAGDAGTAAELLSAALALWPGPALADFRYEEFAQDAIRRLERDRRRARADAVDAQLVLGNHDRVPPEFGELIEEDPHWERPRAQLMLALYRSGSQSEALEVYRSTRTLLDDELGIEPSRDLQELERAILNHDPALGGTPKTTGAAAPIRRRRAALLVAGG
jgi:DNA-binding SARP family transcriptional activator